MKFGCGIDKEDAQDASDYQYGARKARPGKSECAEHERCNPAHVAIRLVDPVFQRPEMHEDDGNQKQGNKSIEDDGQCGRDGEILYKTNAAENIAGKSQHGRTDRQNQW